MAGEFELVTGRWGAVGEVTADVAGVDCQWKAAGLVWCKLSRSGQGFGNGSGGEAERAFEDSKPAPGVERCR